MAYSFRRFGFKTSCCGMNRSSLEVLRVRRGSRSSRFSTHDDSDTMDRTVNYYLVDLIPLLIHLYQNYDVAVKFLFWLEEFLFLRRTYDMYLHVSSIVHVHSLNTPFQTQSRCSLYRRLHRRLSSRFWIVAMETSDHSSTRALNEKVGSGVCSS